MRLVSDVYLTHGLMLLCALAAAYTSLPESTGRVVRGWQPAVTALLAAIAAFSLIAYPTWGDIKNPGLWMFAILAATAVAATLVPSGLSSGHYGQIGKPADDKGAILKNCLDNQGECAPVVY